MKNSANHSAESIAACQARAGVYRHLEKYFGRLVTMQCPANLEEKMRKMAEDWEAVASGSVAS